MPTEIRHGHPSLCRCGSVEAGITETSCCCAQLRTTWQREPGAAELSGSEAINNVLLVKIEEPGAGIPSIIIYLLLKGFLQTPLLINQPMGKGRL